MPNPNPNLEDHESRISALERVNQELHDSLTIMAHLETKQSNYLKEQAAAIDDLRGRDEQRQREIQAHRKMNEETDKRIADLVSAIGRLIAQRPTA